MRRLLLLLAALLVAAEPVRAQRVETRFDDEPEGESLAVEIGKWSSGAIAIAAGAYAFAIQHDAEDRLEELELLCDQSPASCNVDGDGEYADPALENRYQDIRKDYRNSRWLLLGAQALAATSVVLFIIDLPRTSTPDNVPYDPPALRVGARPGGGVEASVRLELPAGF